MDGRDNNAMMGETEKIIDTIICLAYEVDTINNTDKDGLRIIRLAI